MARLFDLHSLKMIFKTDSNNNCSKPVLKYDNLDSNNNDERENLVKRVTAKREYILKNAQNKSGIAPNCGPNNVPSWYEPQSFKHAQQLFRTYEVLLRISQFYGLFLISINDKVLCPLLSTGNSRSVSHLFIRYLSTMVHIRNWFTSDPFDPSTKCYRSLKVVRGYHREVYTKLNGAAQKQAEVDDEVWVNQLRMSYALFDFMGMMTLFPKELGFATFTEYDFHCMFHFWRVIGHCLGTDDRFNICAGTDEEVREMCEQIYRTHWLPKIANCWTEEKVGVKMFEGITIGFFRYIPVINFAAFLRYSAPFMQLNPANFPLKSFWDKFAYYALRFIINLANQAVWTNLVMSAVNRLVFDLVCLFRRHHAKALSEKYDQKFEIDQERCPFEAKFNYRNVFELNLY